MAKAIYNAQLEYSTNTVEIWYTDENGDPAPVGSSVKFKISRADGNGTQEFSPASNVDGHVVFQVTPSTSLLKRPQDNVYDYDNTTFDHVWSMLDNNEVYVRGKLSLVEV